MGFLLGGIVGIVTFICAFLAGFVADFFMLFSNFDGAGNPGEAGQTIIETENKRNAPDSFRIRGVVPVVGLEPTRGISPTDFESVTSTIPSHRLFENPAILELDARFELATS